MRLSSSKVAVWAIAAGAVGDLTIFSADKKWTYRVAESPSKSKNSPFDGREFTGGPVATIVGGKIIYKN